MQEGFSQTAASDLTATAFSNLFVQTEIIPNKHAIICTRRPRSAQRRETAWDVPFLMTMHGKDAIEISYETDRDEFIGRGNSIVHPQAMNIPASGLSGKAGAVLDPICSYQI